MRRIAILLLSLLCLGAVAPGDAPGDAPFLIPAAAQGPVDDLQNATQDLANASARPQYDLISILAAPRTTYLDIPELGVGVYEIVVTDRSPQGTEQYAGAVEVACEPTPVVDENATEVRGWAASRGNAPSVFRNTQSTTLITIVTGKFTTPEFYRVDVVCTAYHTAFTRVVGEFQLVAHVRPYSYMSITSLGIPEKMAPFQEFTHQVAITNNGNQPELFVGSVSPPEGWTVSYPRNVMIGPGETETVDIVGRAPRDKLLYLSGSGTMFVEYGPISAPGKAQTAIVPLQVQGVYVHPALVPLIVLALLISASLVFLAVLTRRAIEEQILGKPVPPWRIPVEREYLRQLERDDPDQFYIVRYYLMVEEHRSALLWFAAYKRATKKDRRGERKWYKVKAKQERKIRAVEKDHAGVQKKWARKAARLDKKRDRKVRRLERKLRRVERKERRTVGRKHKKRVRKIEKRHRKKVKRAEKEWEKRVAKETKKVERQNRKLEKKGEPTLPLPEIPAPDLGEPVRPELKEIHEVPLEASRYGPRAERIRERTERRKERLRIRTEKAVGKHRLAADARIERLQNKIPPEPSTHLHDAAEYVDADQVLVEDDRGLFARLLHIPTLEEREQARRRRAVYAARAKEAKAAGDGQRVEALKAEYRRERARAKELRYADESLARANAIEADRLQKESRRRRSSRRRGRAAAQATPASAPDADGDAAERHDIPVIDRSPAPDAAAPRTEPDREDRDDQKPSLRARFKKTKKPEAASEGASSAAEVPAGEPAAQGRQE